MLGQSAAVAKRPPHANTALNDGTADLLRVQDAVAVTAVSTAATATLAEGIPIAGCWVSFTVDADAYIVFGPDNTLPAASAASGWPMATGVEYNWWASEKDAFFRVIRKTADGNLKRYRSNL